MKYEGYNGTIEVEKDTLIITRSGWWRELLLVRTPCRGSYPCRHRQCPLPAVDAPREWLDAIGDRIDWRRRANTDQGG
jgi:hypothetical protein